MRGRFITFEGGEGSGKSTHAAALAERLKPFGIETVLTREPGGSAGAEIIRHILLSGIAKPLGAETEAILFAAARDDHVRATIRPALVAGHWVICDRFTDATFAYQGGGRQLSSEPIRELENMVQGTRRPDLTILLDAPVEAALARAAARNAGAAADRFERERSDFFERVRNAYLTRAAAEPGRIALVDATQSVDEIGARILGVLKERAWIS